MKHYDLTVFLIKQNEYNWILKTDKNVVLLDFRDGSALDAENKAKQFLSSWTSVNLVIKNEEDK